MPGTDRGPGRRGRGCGDFAEDGAEGYSDDAQKTPHSAAVHVSIARPRRSEKWVTGPKHTTGGKAEGEEDGERESKLAGSAACIIDHCQNTCHESLL